MRKHPILGDVRPYNFISPDGRQVAAWMSVERDHRLGALLIEAVNGESTGQFVYGMPKIHYPYRRDKEVDLENVTLDGDPATNTEAIYGAAGEWIYVDVVAWVDDEPRVIVRCNPGP